MSENAFMLSHQFLSRGYKLLLLVAPQASGKTAFLRRWSESLHEDRQQVAWLTLTSAENEPEIFLTRLILALGCLSMGFKERVKNEVHLDRDVNLEEEMTTLINILVDQPGSLILIMDNYHLITA